MKKYLLIFFSCIILTGCGSITEEVFSENNKDELIQEVTESDLTEEERSFFQYAVSNTENQQELYDKKVSEIISIGQEMQTQKQLELKRQQEIEMQKAEKKKAENIPEGFAGYSWGTSKESFPKITFIMNPEASFNSMYKINTPSEINTKYLLNDVSSKEVFVFFTKNKLFLGRIVINRQDAEKVRQALTTNYGTPQKEQNKYFTSYKWQNDLAVIVLRITQDSADIEVIEPNYYRNRA